MKIKKDKHDATNDLMLIRSNVLIESKHNCTLMENKLIALGMATVKIDKSGIPYSDIPVALLKTYDGIENTNVYKTVKKVADNITKHTVICEEQIATGQKRFEIFTLVTNAEYIEGEATFKLTFNTSIVPMISNLQGNYTKHRIKCLMSFCSNYAYRLYELLSIKEYLLYPKNNKEALENVDIVFDSLNDLKMQLTLISVDDESLKPLVAKPYNELKAEEKKKLNKILEKAMYKNWSDFKSKILDVAQMQMKENPYCPICFTYTPIKSGRGGKVTGIVFHIQKNKNHIIENDNIKENSRTKEKQTIERLILQVRSFMQHENIAEISIIKLLEIANNDVEKIKAAYDLALKQNCISNLIGWMSEAIKGNWAQQENVIHLKNRTQEESKHISAIHEEYINEIEQYSQIENEEHIALDFENEEIEVEEKDVSLDSRFIDLFMKSSRGEELTEEEDEEMKLLLLQFTQKKFKKKK